MEIPYRDGKNHVGKDKSSNYWNVWTPGGG
jgi:hypothetical protein